VLLTFIFLIHSDGAELDKMPLGRNALAIVLAFILLEFGGGKLSVPKLEGTPQPPDSTPAK
jgi:hypothetical protein